MKNNYLAIILLIMFAVILTGCSCEKKKEEPITITCTAPNSDNDLNMEVNSVVTYTFNNDQVAIEYKNVTTQKFTDDDTFGIYKAAQEDAAKDTSEENITYTLEANDSTKTIIFTTIIKNYDSFATTEEEKENLKASAILSEKEELEFKCELKGIERSELK